ncbi:RNA-splicing ligase RtcB [Thermoplasmatales archaeon SM1-50]|nr:MAG: RNA-splicing ligase RtcB [Thermoplasmatales archaeon SM1-50]
MNWNGPLLKMNDFRFEIPSNYQGVQNNLHMKTSGVIYATNGMIKSIRMDYAPEQVANVTMLPGIVGKSLAMPDIHWGYGFPIGGVAAMDEENGVISPGGVGYDINCGVRLLRTNLHFTDLDSQKIQHLVDEMFINVPSGLGSKAKVHLNRKQLDDVLKLGAKWAIENGYGWKEDPEYIEEHGCLDYADISKVSNEAKQRGAPQLGSLGAGNHFLEIQKVDEIYDESAAKAFGIQNIGQIMVMIHTGSRGFGHQVCTDHLRVLGQAVKKYNIWLPDRQLACAPVTSKEGQDYLKAMACAANFAWCNRQMIVHWVRESFGKILHQCAEDLDMGIVYDVCHNIAKLEEHEIEGKKKKVYVHRKGATRSFGPDKQEVPLRYRDVGQPVLIPGDMGTESYLLRGTKESEETFGSTCHGAGRVMSRTQAVHRYRGEQIINQLKQKGIYAHPASWKVMAEEAPDAYKNVSEVVNVTHGAGISSKVVKLLPLGVVKG